MAGGDAKTPTLLAVVSVCPYFRRGFCARGAECKDAHLMKTAATIKFTSSAVSVSEGFCTAAAAPPPLPGCVPATGAAQKSD